MNNTSSLLLMVVPESILGPMLVLLIMAGGIAIVLSFRRQGVALVLTAISFPIVAVMIEALMNELFAGAPAWLIIPASILLLLILFLGICWTLIKMVFGQRAVDEAKGHLLADALRWCLRKVFTRAGLVLVASVFLLLNLGVVL